MCMAEARGMQSGTRLHLGIVRPGMFGNWAGGACSGRSWALGSAAWIKPCRVIWGQHSTIFSPRRVRGYLSTVVATDADLVVSVTHFFVMTGSVQTAALADWRQVGMALVTGRVLTSLQYSSGLCWGRFCGHCQGVHASSKLDEFSRASSPAAGPKAGNNHCQHPETASRPTASILPGSLMSGERPRLQASHKHVCFAF